LEWASRALEVPSKYSEFYQREYKESGKQLEGSPHPQKYSK
jgi:hypothetical protein